MIHPTLSRRRFLHGTLIAAGLTSVGAGCDYSGRNALQPTTESQPAPEVPLKVLVVDDAPLGDAIKRERKSVDEKELEIVLAAREKIAGARRLPADVIIFPSMLLGELAERGLIVPLAKTQEEDPLALRDVFPLLRLHEITWGDATYAAPLGSPQLVLVWRTDIFEHLELGPPATWQEYGEACTKLADRSALGSLAPAEGETWRASAEPLGSGWGGHLLLARAAAYAGHREQISPLFDLATCEPLIDRPPFARALTELVEVAKRSAPHVGTPREAYSELLAGRCAMALTWPVGRAAQPDSKEQAISFAELPGSRDVYDFATKDWQTREPNEGIHVPLVGMAGRLVAVTSSTGRADVAEGFVAWLTSAETAGKVSPASEFTTVFRTSQAESANRWCSGGSLQAAQYFAVVQAAQSRPKRVATVRLIAADRYMAALDAAVSAAVSGTSPEEALRAAAQEWEKSTEEVGRAAQKSALKHSLGIPVR